MRLRTRVRYKPRLDGRKFFSRVQSVYKCINGIICTMIHLRHGFYKGLSREYSRNFYNQYVLTYEYNIL